MASVVGGVVIVGFLVANGVPKWTLCFRRRHCRRRHRQYVLVLVLVVVSTSVAVVSSHSMVMLVLLSQHNEDDDHGAQGQSGCEVEW